MMMSEIPDDKIRNDPRYAAAMNELTNSCRMYWRRNVHSYFNLREAYWGLDRKTDHRISISTGGEKILANVLEVHWVPETGHVTVRPGKLMVRGGKGRDYNLIDILTNKMGSRPSRGAYRVEIDRRVKWGNRAAQTSYQWTRWMNVFVAYVDKKINEVADVVAEITGDSIEREILEEEF
jgi:hypothetical protein